MKMLHRRLSLFIVGLVCVVFFFQAEDGIRDLTVTGVQTCALPIFIGSIASHAQVTTATVYGVVQDPTGAVLPGATVVATNQGTNLSRESVTDERGEDRKSVV